MRGRDTVRPLVAFAAVLALLVSGVIALGIGPLRGTSRADGWSVARNGVAHFTNKHTAHKHRHARLSKPPRLHKGPRSPKPPTTPSTTPTPPVTTPPTTPATDLKDPVRGLLDRQHYPKGYDSVVKSFVIDVPWAQLQPTPGGPLVHPNAIDDELALAQSAGLTVKLRVGAGVDAPDWAKRIGGDPIPMYYTAATVAHAGELAGTIGRFWLPAFGAAYDDLQQKLAAAYDDNPTLAQVAITRCSTIFSETYLRNTKDPANANALVAAGFTRAADDVCHDEQMRSHLVWTHTRSSLTINPYQAISADGSVKQDLAYSLTQMAQCRQILGRRCVLENYSLSSSRIGDQQYGQIYATMQQLGAPFDFQTATMAKVGNLPDVLAYASSIGATSVELPSGYTDYTPDQLAPYQNALSANSVG